MYLQLNQGISYEVDAVMPAAVDTGLFVSLATFKRRPSSGGEPVIDALGQVDTFDEDYALVVGLTNIVCMLSVQKIGAPNQAAKMRQPTEFRDESERHLLLDSYYPAILETDIVDVDGTDYQIMQVEHDTQFQQTRLAVRTYTI